jgi:predicted CXXCH cytochrome family protein
MFFPSRNKVSVILFSAVFLTSAVAVAGIEGSAHDLTAELSIDEICVVCHTPHNAVDPVAEGLDYAPLWNHEVSSSGPYTLYTSSTLDHTPGQPDGVAKLCLSCHDGSVAMENYGGTTTGTTMVANAMFDGAPGTAVGSARDFGTSLDNDHPISLDYAAVAAADNEIYAATTVTPLGGTIADDLLVDGKVQCSSCHDVHDVNGNDHLLLIDNTNSAMCLACHEK